MSLRDRVLTAAFVLLACSAVLARSDATRGLELAQQYLESWQVELAAVVAEERYEQTRSVWKGATGRFLTPSWQEMETRRTSADVLLLRSPVGDAWLSFRDVFEVDGRPVRDREQRFERLFRTPNAQLATDARRIADESARFNLGHVTRNVNTPTAALVFLQPTYAEHTKWSLDSRARLDDAPAWLLQFEQREPPFAVKSPTGQPLPATGRIWLEPQTGRILRTEMRLRASTVISRVDTRYGPAPGLESWVPLRMEDQYEVFERERVSSVAVYTNHRLFQTAARIVGGTW